MALGHALLHPGRLRQALNADAKADNMTAGADVALAMAGFGDPGPAAEAWAVGVAQRFQPIGEKLGRIAETGPLAALLQPLSDEADVLQRRFESLLNGVAALDADALRRALTALIDEMLAVLPDLRMRSLRDVVHTEINAALGILEQPLRDGRRDAAAHRAFRTAAEIRRRLSRLEDELPPGVGDIDLKVILRAQALRVLNALDAAGLGALTAQLAAFRTEFGPLFSALSRLSVRVEVRVDGPQTMATGNPDYTDESKVTPFPRGHALWLMDLITGVIACFNLFWEMIRTRNFSGRGLDGTASVLLLIWQVVRMTVRIGWPDQLSEAASGKQWLFTDQADFVMSVGLRFLMAFHEIGTDTNFVGSVLIRALKHVTAVSQPRFLYQWNRALWYLDSWKKAPEATRGEPDFLRVFWAAWGSQWATASLGGLFPPWEDFHLEGAPGAMLASLFISLALGAGGSIFTLTKLADWSVAEPPFWTRIIISAFLVVTVVLVAFLLAGLESDDAGLAIGLLILFSLLLVGPLVLTFLKPQSAGFTYWLIITTEVLLAATVPFVLWWVYIDDGRDKPGLFDGIKERADSSPYRLPFPGGENWMCSQGTHGIFSHHTYEGDATDNNETSESNHYAYDFNETEGSTAVAARDGIVISVDDHNPNRGEDANSLDVMHLDWHPEHDYGTEDERQLNAGTYFHVMQHSIAPALNQPIARGQKVALVDSTGRSAQHHIHFAAMEHQRTGDTDKRPLRRSLPFVFGDESTQQRRQYYLLGWIPGKGKIAGKPIAYAFYVSDNTAPSSVIATALEFSLAEPSAGTPHFHRVVLPASVVAGAGDAVVMAQPSLGHTHQVTVLRALINDLLHGEPSWPAAGLVVAPGADGHTHAALRFPLTLLQLNLDENDTLGTSSGVKHTHSVTVDFRQLLDGAITPQTLTSSQHSFTPPTPAGAPPPAAFTHTHQVTLQPAALIDMLHRRPPAAADVSVDTVDAHTHTISGKVPARTRTGVPGLTPLIVAPPTGRMIANTLGPYRLMGEQAALRTNDRRTEAWMFGAHRAALVGDVPAERGVTSLEPLQSGVLTVAPAVEARASPRIAARELTNAIRAIGAVPAPAPRPPHTQAAVVASPVLVIETRARGSAARLSVGPGSAALFGPPGPESRGAGNLADLQSFTLANLVTLVNGFLQNGWPTPPAGALNAFGPGGPVIDPAPSAPRTGAVLSRSINPATNGLFPANALPLQPGFVGVTAGFTVPILAAPAVRPLDLREPAMTGVQRTATPLVININGADQPVNFRAGDTDAVSVARRIMLEADGVRATPIDANSVLVSTIAGGSGIGIALTKSGPTPLLGGSNGLSADLPGRTPVTDTGAVPPLVLQGVVADAVARDVLPYNPAVVLPVATVNVDRLRLAVSAGNTIRLAAQGLTLVPGSDPAGTTWSSEPMPAALSLAGSSWIDIEVAGNIVRVPLTGEPARVELGPLPRLPAASEELVLRVGGADVRVRFDGTETNIGAVAERIAAAAPDQFSVRFAWQIAVARTLHGDGGALSPLQLAESVGLGVLGFLRDRLTLLDRPEGVFSDHLAAGPGGRITEQNTSAGVRRRLIGPLSTALSVQAGDPPTLAGPAGQVLTTAVTPAGTDVLGFTPPTPNQARVGAALPVALTRGCVTWNFELRQGGVVQARAIGQLSAMPAAIRATVPPVDQGALSVTITVVRPDGISPSAIIDLAGVRNAIDACDRLMRAPGIAAFPVTFDDQAETVVVHIETIGRGTGWRLRLEGRAAILALGFRPPQFDVTTEVLEVGGGGTVADGAAVTADEVRAMLNRAAATTTGPEAVPPLYELTAPPGGSLVMTPSGDALSFRSQPPEAAAALGATPGAGGSLTIPAGPPAPGPSLLQVLTGSLHTTLPVLGQVAVLRAPNPPPADGTADATAQLTFLQTNGLNVQVDGAFLPVPASPTPFATVNEAVEWINRHIAPGWAGLVPELAPGAPAHLVLRGARRGNGGTVAVTFPAAPPLPAGGVLGLTAATAAVGVGGTLADVDSVIVLGGAGTLQNLLAGRATRPDIPQTQYRAVGDDAAGTVRLLPNGVGLNIAVTASTIPFTPVNGVLQATPGPAVTLRPEVIGLTASRQSEETRVITGALWGRNARLAALALPANLAVLATRQLLLEVDGRPFTITLTAPANVAALAAQIARGTDWTVRAFAAPAGLVLETVSEGTASRLILTAGNAVTGNPATGFVAPSPLPLDARGDGSVPNMASVKPSDLAAAFQAAWSEDTTPDDALLLNQALDATAYAPDAPTGNGFMIASRRRGVAGRLEFIAGAALGTPINWDDSLSRGAAERAAVAFPAFAGTLAPNGPLAIGLDESAPADLPASRTINVAFDGTPLTAAQVAARINAALRAADAGAASAWPDGRVVIETAGFGLAGSVRIPATGAPRGAADVLLQGGGDLFARGWPGAGRSNSLNTMTIGWRGVRSTAKEAATYTFLNLDANGATVLTTNPVAIAAGSDPATVAVLLNNAFDLARAGGAPRIGLAGVVDGALCVEAFDPALTLRVDGVALATAAASTPGTTPELTSDKAFDMRRTDWVRTVRLTLAASDDSLFNPSRDLQYLRPPAHIDTAQPGGWDNFPMGRWLVVVRPDAARAGDVPDVNALRNATAMVTLSFTIPGAALRASPQIVRFWPSLSNGNIASLRGASAAGAEPFQVDLLTWQR